MHGDWLNVPGDRHGNCLGVRGQKSTIASRMLVIADV